MSMGEYSCNSKTAYKSSESTEQAGCRKHYLLYMMNEVRGS